MDGIIAIGQHHYLTVLGSGNIKMQLYSKAKQCLWQNIINNMGRMLNFKLCTGKNMLSL